MSELCFTAARRLARLIRTRKVSASEAMRAFIDRIERVNPKVNAIVTFLPEAALAAAKKLDRRLARKGGAEGLGPLAGLPIAYKDMVPTRGIRTTFGSPIYAEHVPAEDHALVERLSAAGAITLGKTNTPEFAAGSQTFNPVFGATLNPYDTSKTCGGSSGGAAVAVACGMLPFADGSDLGASLRNPGNFCNVVGFRPTPGRVPAYPSNDSWASLSVMGPLARSVADAALLFSAMAGPDRRAPISIVEPGQGFARALARSFKGVRVAWSRDLGGLPVDRRVTQVLEAQRGTFAALGCVVEDAEPELAGADEAFQVLRAVLFVQKYAALLKAHRGRIKDTVIWNIEQGLKLDGPRIAQALNLRSQVFHALRAFLERYEFLLLPVNQVPPFAVTQAYPTEINGVKLANYIEWMKTCYAITVTSHPAISVPAGFTSDSPPLPVGIQIVGRYRDDFGVLQLAHAFEQATQCGRQRPKLA
ncbi:MAG: amidase [Betaproteobacteria bacterium]|nr:MAG: amidase [Betaproteobacteria bacterium]